MVPKPRGTSLSPPWTVQTLLFCDGSCKQSFQETITGLFATVSLHETLGAHSLPTIINSAQVAELLALTQACILAEGKIVNYRHRLQIRLWGQLGCLAHFGNPRIS